MATSPTGSSDVIDQNTIEAATAPSLARGPRTRVPGVPPITSPIVDVPRGLLVECPLVEKKLRAIEHCQGCEHFAGLLDQFPGAAHLAFSKRHMVACRFPFGRAIYEISEE